ncbi:MAG: DUF3160 domain-containing protein [Cyanobacteria bacterium HKST-UBA02]|nr:DUF3160 domain-containing protein [Cyanobacteria bacterium HKST-UBA02]
MRRSVLALLMLLLQVPFLPGVAPAAMAQLSESEISPTNRSPGFRRPGAIKFEPKREVTLEDIFPHRDIAAPALQPMALGKTKIPGLDAELTTLLGNSYFVVVSDGSYDTFSGLYENNRVSGKSSFVSADSLLHPYFGFRNALMAALIESTLSEDMKKMLVAAFQATIHDYRQCEDEEVKDDLQRNLAYLGVALKILDPAYEIQDIGGAAELMKQDLELFKKGAVGRSAIFNQVTDFSVMKPWGFLDTSDRLRRFASCYQWLSRMYFPLSNITNSGATSGGNSFRRAVLLYRSLSISKVGGQPALAYWNRVGNAFILLGMDYFERLNTIVLTDMAPELDKSNKDFGKLLEVLSQPFLRTKLMLSIRRQRPVELRSTSIFEVGDRGKTRDIDRIRFFPVVEPQEIDWIRDIAGAYVPEANAPTPTPVALLTMHAHGAPLATNLLSMQTGTLDSRLVKAVPSLERELAFARGGREREEIDCRWRIVSGLFAPYPDSVQPALRSHLWMMRQLESAIAAWVDSYTALIPVTAASGSTDSKAATVPPAAYHYLDPRPAVYKAVAEDCQDVVNELAKLGLGAPPAYKSRAEDFIRLYLRMQAIAEAEIKGTPPGKSDLELLGNIDRILMPVDNSPIASLHFSRGLSENKGEESKTTSRAEGLSLGVGKPGRLFFICLTGKGATLCRGGLYNYYEVGGGPFKREHWLRKLDFGLLRPPIWASQFDFVRDK